MLSNSSWSPCVTLQAESCIPGQGNRAISVPGAARNSPSRAPLCQEGLVAMSPTGQVGPYPTPTTFGMTYFLSTSWVPQFKNTNLEKAGSTRRKLYQRNYEMRLRHMIKITLFSWKFLRLFYSSNTWKKFQLDLIWFLLKKVYKVL